MALHALSIRQFHLKMEIGSERKSICSAFQRCCGAMALHRAVAVLAIACGAEVRLPDR